MLVIIIHRGKRTEVCGEVCGKVALPFLWSIRFQNILLLGTLVTYLRHSVLFSFLKKN